MNTTQFTPESSHGDFKPWKCGDPHSFPFPQADERQLEDPWTNVVENLLDKEKFRCEAWKEEVQNLLIFSGLFSAVVTAFLVESYKTLRQDPADSTVLLLSFIASHLSNGTSGPVAPTVTNQFSPTESGLRVNIFWFLSLIFSLATALVGIISLQWLREHQRPMQNISPLFAASLLQMNSEALDRYYVPHIFATLPLLLLTGLVLFLIGMIDFLWNMNTIVAAPVLSVIALTITFVLFTTIWPGLQAAEAPFSHWKNDVRPPAPCPYKSPQSWAFIQLVKSASFKRPRSTMAPVHWLQHGLRWLRKRDYNRLLAGKYIPKKNEFISPSSDFSPIYDGVQALMRFRASRPVMGDAEGLVLCKCFNQLSHLSYGDEIFERDGLAPYIHNLLPLHPEGPSAAMHKALPAAVIREWKPTYEVLVDYARLAFRLYVTDSSYGFRILSLHYAEICVRLTEWLYASGPRMLPGGFPVDPPLVLVSLQLHPNIDPDVLTIDVQKDFVKQVLNILEKFFDNAAMHPDLVDGAESTTYTDYGIYKFLLAAIQIIGWQENWPEPEESDFGSLLSSIASRVSGDGNPYFFVVASMFAKCIVGYGCRKPQAGNSLNYLLLKLRRQKEWAETNHDEGAFKLLEATMNWRPADWYFLRKAFLPQSREMKEGHDLERPSTNSAVVHSFMEFNDQEETIIPIQETVGEEDANWTTDNRLSSELETMDIRVEAGILNTTSTINIDGRVPGNTERMP